MYLKLLEENRKSYQHVASVTLEKLGFWPKISPNTGLESMCPEVWTKNLILCIGPLRACSDPHRLQACMLHPKTNYPNMENATSMQKNQLPAS